MNGNSYLLDWTANDNIYNVFGTTYQAHSIYNNYNTYIINSILNHFSHAPFEYLQTKAYNASYVARLLYIHVLVSVASMV
jgi:hypothetical protein